VLFGMRQFWRPERRLSAQVEADLGDLTDAIAERVCADVIAVAPAEPLWAVCLEAGSEAEPILIPVRVHLCSLAERDRILASGAGLDELWTYVDGWSTGGFEVDDMHAPELEARLFDALDAAGSDEPNRYVLNLAARQLARAGWAGIQTSDDFVVYVRSPVGADVEFSGTPEALALLRGRGLLFDPG
jgi:hypothetical protein